MATKIDIVIEAVDNLSGTVKQIERNVTKMTADIVKSSNTVQRSTKQMSENSVRSLDKMNTAFGALSTNMRRIGALVGSIYAVRSAITALGDVADDFKSFNEGMAYVNTIAQLTDTTLANLTQQVEDLSIQMGKSAPEMARGLYDIYSSGFEGAEAMKILEVATRGAIAGMTKTTVAAKGLMAVMNAYNRKTGADAIDIMDSMFKTVDKGVITFEELASEIGSVVTASSQLGIPFDQISAAMSEMTLRGISAAESATALESLMRSLMNPSDQAKEAIKKLNVENKKLNFEWDVATLRAKGLNGVMKDLSKASQGNFEVVGKIIPNIRGMRAAMVLATDDGEGFNEMLEEQANRVGATQRAFEEANKSINRQLEETRAEWDKYKRDIGEVLANVELNLFKNLVSFAKWADKNKQSILATAEAIKQITIAFIAFKAVTLSIAGVRSLIVWFGELKYAVQVASLAMQEGIAVAGNLKLVLTALANPLVITITIVGALYVLRELNKIKSVYADIANQSAMMRKQAREIQTDFAVKSISDQKILETVKARAQKESDDKTLKQAQNLQDNIAKLEKAREEKTRYMAVVGEGSGDFIVKMNRQITSLNTAITEGKTLLEESGKLTGGLLTSPSEKNTGITTNEYDDYPTTEELLGSEVDKAAQKIATTIKKVKKEISEYYIDLGDLSNDEVKALKKEGEALEEASLKWERYLEDINIDLIRLADTHKKTVISIQDDIANENRDFSESMDERLRKFNATMASMTTSHTDKTNDLQHQIDLEEGMGARADKEKLRELYLRLARENRDFADKVAKDKEEKEREDEIDRRSNEEKITDFEERLDKKVMDYEQKVKDIKRYLDREKFDYAAQQDEIRAKTQDTLRGIVEDYQKAFKKIFDAIRDSGVPSLLAKLPELTQDAMDSSITGVDIPRNLNAEQEFVKNWGGLHGRLPTTEEISQGVYGTPTGPNNAMNITINNPVVLDESYTSQMIQQIETQLGNNQRLANKGAY